MLPREKACKYGIKTLCDYELLALIIKSGNKNNSVFEISKKLIEKANGFENFLSLNYEELIQVKGISNAKAYEILAILEICKRINSKLYSKAINLNNLEDVIAYLRTNIAFDNQENFCVLFLNNKLNLIRSEILFKGSKNSSIVAIDEIIRRAILNKSSSIIISHNHPSGDIKPSIQDIQITKNITNLCKLLNISVLDHIIITKSSYYSFKQENII